MYRSVAYFGYAEMMCSTVSSYRSQSAFAVCFC